MILVFQESYEGLPIEQKVNILLGAIANVAEIPEEGRQLAAVMLRRLFSSEFEEFFGKVSGVTWNNGSGMGGSVLAGKLTRYYCSCLRSRKLFSRSRSSTACRTSPIRTCGGSALTWLPRSQGT